MSEYTDLISRFGYIGILLGSFLEGETTIVISGVFAKLGYFNLKSVIFYSFIGTFIGDSFFFFLGKHFGRPIIERYEFLKKRAMLASKIVHQYRNYILFVMRFLAGFRSPILLLLGCSNIQSVRFLAFDFVTSFIWSAIVAVMGYFFANVIFIFVNDIKGYEAVVVPAVVLLSAGGILFYRHFVKEKEEEQFDGD
jgi:membrane protein DedA with SNARE-associated domain